MPNLGKYFSQYRPTLYERDFPPHIKGSDTAANRRTLVVPAPMRISIYDLTTKKGKVYEIDTDIEPDLNTDANWDKKSVAATWASIHNYSLDAIVKPTVANNYIYHCIDAGESGGSEPTWPSNPGETMTDGGVIWMCCPDYTIPINRAGTDIYVYACVPTSGNTPSIILSTNSTMPLGKTMHNSRKIGGSHCIPITDAPTWTANTVIANVGYVVQPVTPNSTNRYIYRCTSRGDSPYKTHATTEPVWPTTIGNTVSDGNITWVCDANGCENLTSGTDPYYGFLMGDILFNSIYDIRDRPRCSPEGTAKLSLTPSDGRKAKRMDIYLASNDGSICTSIYGNTIKDTQDWPTFNGYAALQGKRLPFDHEFQDAATGSNEGTNVAGSADPVTVKFGVDTAGRSMISRYGIIGMCGVMFQWLQDQFYQYSPDGSVQTASVTATVTHVASPGGNPIYVKFKEDGKPYLCCNLATVTAAIWLAFGTNFRILLTHDANASTGTQIYFDDDGTQPGRILANLAAGKNVYVESNNPSYALQIYYSATANTVGVVLNYDDGADNRLEATCAHSANAAIDLALLTPAYANVATAALRGGIQKAGYLPDLKITAGGYYGSATMAGSYARALNAHRFYAGSIIGARYIAEAA